MSSGDNDFAIEFNGVSKLYNTYTTPRHRLLEIISSGRRKYSHEARALDDVTFRLKRGGRLGIVGENGSGKSTLLKILAGVLNPTSGEVKVQGRISALLELGAGLNPELSGRENIQQYCMFHGMRHEEITKAIPDIISFSELREAIEHPVKTYSSGMSVRLGFSCAVYVQPDILIVDEALSVGDAYFQNKCLHKVRSMLNEGITFIYVTHAADSIRTLCNEGLWLEKGKIRLKGDSKEVGSAYQSEVFSRMVRSGLKAEQEKEENDQSEISSSPVKQLDSPRQKVFAERVAPLRTGSGEILIDDIAVISNDGEETDNVEFDDRMCIRVFFHCEKALTDKCALTVGIFDKLGNQLLHFNSAMNDIYPSDAPLRLQQMVEVVFKSPLCPGEYGISSGISVLSESPLNYGQTLIDTIVDSCPNGSRFSVKFPVEKIKKDLWGHFYVDSKMSMHSLG